MHWLVKVSMGYFFCLALVACGPTTETPDPKPKPQKSVIPKRPCPENNTLTYENFGKGFFLTWCNGCHSSTLKASERAGAPVGIDFDSLEGIRKHTLRIFARSGDANATMPPVSVPDEKTRKLLGDWLTCGAPVEQP